MDILADWLRLLGASGVVLARSRFAAPWGIGFEPCDGVVFHLVLDGVCFLRQGDAAPLKLGSGDLVLLPQGSAHEIVHHPAGVAEPLDQLLARAPSPQPGDVVATIVCGTYAANRWIAQPMLRALPTVAYFSAERVRANGAITAILALLAAEVERPAPGSEILIQHLFDALFLYVMRAWIDEDASERPGWLAALRDPALGKALSSIHAEPSAAWTVAALASTAGLSRAAFARRFNQAVGEPPLTYLTRWRMGLAAELLSGGSHPLPEVAKRIGYESEFTFSRAFKRSYGVAPATYRRHAASSGPDRRP
jgi:AraC-like DNA-binding protein